MARSVSAEMHAGFGALREHMSMNIRGRYPGKGRTPACLADIERIVAIWTDCRARFGGGGDFLFGRFGIAEAMFAPVAWRWKVRHATMPKRCWRCLRFRPGWRKPSASKCSISTNKAIGSASLTGARSRLIW